MTVLRGGPRLGPVLSTLLRGTDLISYITVAISKGLKFRPKGI